MENGILYGLISILIFGSYKLLAKGSGQIVSATEGVFKLKMNRFFLLFGWLLLVISILVLLVPVFYPDEKDYTLMVVLMGGLGLFFGGCGLFLIAIYKNHELEYKGPEFKVKGYFNKINVGQFSEIERVRYSAFTNLIKLKMKNGKKIKCSQFLVGITSFLEKIENEKGIKLDKIKGQILWK